MGDEDEQIVFSFEGVNSKLTVSFIEKDYTKFDTVYDMLSADSTQSVTFILKNDDGSIVKQWDGLITDERIDFNPGEPIVVSLTLDIGTNIVSG